MTAFALSALALTLIALGLLTRPLWGRRQAGKGAPPAGKVDEIVHLRARVGVLEADLDSGRISDTQHASERADVERRIVATVLADAAPATASQAPAGSGGQAVLAIGLCVGVAFLAALGYAVVGTPQALLPAVVSVASAASGADAKAITPQQVEQLVERLTVRLKERPDDLEGWTILGRSHAVLGRPQQAAAAFKQALALKPGDADLMTHYADALAVANQGFDGEPRRYIESALKADPDNLKALSLAGSAAFERQDYALAVTHWERMARLTPSNEFRDQIQAGIDEARRLMGAQTAPATSASAGVAAASPPTQPAAATSVSGVVSLAPALAGQVGRNDTVFVFARSVDGPRMPLAILRRKVSDLPFAFTLDDSLAMSPAAQLSSAGSVIVGARISRSGDATTATGDLQGASIAVRPGATDVQVEIRDVVGP
ncbi:MAG: c-type cytochrome biogenesis protein CcmI [Burkholderiaceae bacterium]